ncbi:MAG: hypothetical protein ACJ8AT_18110 [Hyalangium sp.]|uniref:hypothetical protein n=1 Tax=Hyalangium sp. TaxID=2028555 RepID=UPI00389ACAB9
MAATTPAEALPTQAREVSPPPTEAPASVAVPPPAIAQPTLAAESPPDWVRDIWRKYTRRVLDYFRQSFALLVGPRRFMEQWATGQRETLNPLRFMGLGIVMALTTRHLGERYVLDPASEIQNVAPLLKIPLVVDLIFLVLALPAHGVMRLSGSRAPLRATVAAIIFTATGPLVLMHIVGWLLSGLCLVLTGSAPLMEIKAGLSSRLYRHSAYPWPIIFANMVALFYFVRAIAGVHRARWGWALLALLVAHAVFFPFISTLTKIDASDLSRVTEHVKAWLGHG